MALSYFRMLIPMLLNKDSYIVPEVSTLILLDRNYSVCMAKNVKYTNHARHIYRRVNFVIIGEKCKMHKIDCCEGGLKLVDIVTKSVGDNGLNTGMKYIMVSIDN